ncbi:hypothetical protein [Angustibacter luteus]|uniref:Uncharacterized protein n=1 Tax=Angustibacter luteus TaxID=658456 RepID=A0ABW1JJ03_9ACTN
MASPLAHCPTHGIFEAQIIGLGQGSEVTFRGSATRCPICGRAAPILDGTYVAGVDELGDELVRVFNAPGWTLAKIRQLQRALEQVRTEPEENIDLALARVAAIDPQVAAVLKARQGSGKWTRMEVIALVGLLVTTLFGLAGLRREDHGDVNEERVRQLIEQEIENARPDLPGASSDLPSTEPGSHRGTDWP